MRLGVAEEVTVAAALPDVWEEFVFCPQQTASENQSWQGCFWTRATDPAIVLHNEPSFLLWEIYCVIWDNTNALYYLGFHPAWNPSDRIASSCYFWLSVVRLQVLLFWKSTCSKSALIMDWIYKAVHSSSYYLDSNSRVKSSKIVPHCLPSSFQMCLKVF